MKELTEHLAETPAICRSIVTQNGLAPLPPPASGGALELSYCVVFSPRNVRLCARRPAANVSGYNSGKGRAAETDPFDFQFRDPAVFSNRKRHRLLLPGRKSGGFRSDRKNRPGVADQGPAWRELPPLFCIHGTREASPSL